MLAMELEHGRRPLSSEKVGQRVSHLASCRSIALEAVLWRGVIRLGESNQRVVDFLRGLQL
jgi:hypothetical protein